MQKVYLGPAVAEHAVKDFSAREMIIMATLTVSIVVLGLYPQPVIDMAKTVINDLLVKR
jgi:NADH-quinone oxidoreductase subunit M